VRGVVTFALACGLLATIAGIRLAQTYGLNPADGGALAPLSVRLAWGIGVALLGLAFAAGMILYGRCYVARLALDEANEQLHAYTVNGWLTLHREIIPLSALKPGRRHRGRLFVFWRGLLVDAPWRTVWVSGRRLPLILDEQGQVLDPQRMRRLGLG